MHHPRTTEEREALGLSTHPRTNKKLHTSMWRKVSAFGLITFLAITLTYFTLI